MAAHEYWRINVTANDGDVNFLAIAEMEMRATIGGADQAVGGTATASASDGSSPPGNAFDNNSTTRWSTPVGTLTGWLRYQFTSPVDVVEYTIQAHPTTPARSPRDFTLESSDDGIVWSPEDLRSGETGWTNGEIRVYEVTAVPASAEARMTQAAMLVLDAPESDARMTQLAMLVLSLLPDAADGVRMTQATMLALAEFEAGVRMTQACALVLADQVNCLTRWAQTWTITRTDGQVFAFTSLDRPLTFRGIEHLPCNSMLASAVELSTVVGATGNMELNGILSDSGVSEADLYNGLFDGASIEVWMVPWDNSGGEIPFRLMGGVVGTNGHGETSFNQEILTPGAQLAQRALLETYTPGCRYGFGNSVDPRCPVDLVALTVSGSVTGTAIPNASTTATRRIFTDSTRAEADGFFNLGRLTWTGGPNAGAVSEIKDFTGGQFILWEALLSPIAIGDTYDATPGCDKSSADHLLFNPDMVDFGGFPMVPGSDSILQSPDAKV